MPQIGVDALHVVRFAFARSHPVTLWPRIDQVAIRLAAVGKVEFGFRRGVHELLRFFPSERLADAERKQTARYPVHGGR